MKNAFLWSLRWVLPVLGLTASPPHSQPVLETFLLLGRILLHWALVIGCELGAFSQTAPQEPRDRHSCPGSQVSLPEKVSFFVHRPGIYHVLHVPQGPLGTPERPNWHTALGHFMPLDEIYFLIHPAWDYTPALFHVAVSSGTHLSFCTCKITLTCIFSWLLHTCNNLWNNVSQFLSSKCYSATGPFHHMQTFGKCTASISGKKNY